MSEKVLNIGDRAPEFAVLNQNGQEIKLADYRGKKVLLYFYPKDNTPGCTAEACSFRDNYQELIAAGIIVLGVSIDSEKSHKKFTDKFELPFPLLADVDKEIVSSYGVWGEKSMYGKSYMGITRKSFLIDEEGKISHIIEKVDTKNASTQVLDLLKK